MFVERHHDGSRAVASDPARLVEERVLAFFQGDRVDDAFPLQALQPRFENRPLRAVDHDRQPRDLRLGRKVVEERRHRLLRLEQIGVHVDVEEVRSAAHLLECDLDRAAEVAALDEAPEPRGARDVRAFAHQREVRVLEDLERLEPAERGRGTSLQDNPWSLTPDGV